MAGKRKRKNGTFEYVFKRAGVLDRPLYFTFHDEAEGDAFAANLDRLLDRGIVPTEFLPESKVLTLAELISHYQRDAHPSNKDRRILAALARDLGKEPLAAIDVAWVDHWIRSMKREDKLAPATIRSKVGALARCCDWGIRGKLLTMPDHPFRTLPNGYSQYTALDERLAGVRRVDVERDRRLEPGEHERVLAVLEAGVLPRAQRPLQLEHVPALRCLFVLAQESAMRLREMYTLTLAQVDLPARTVYLIKTKNGNRRQVPLSSVALAELRAYLAVRVPPEGQPEGILFPWWDGSTQADDLHRLSDNLSTLWRSIFTSAGLQDFVFHDLRHEATSRLFERTALSDTEIMKVTGHKDVRMLARYANLRASSLAARIW